MHCPGRALSGPSTVRAGWLNQGLVSSDDLLRDLTESQRTAVVHGEGPLLVVAGPGSGKTRVITHRIAHLIEHGVPPSCILAITFTNKAAQEMARRVEALTSARGAWVKTFHATCAAILRRWPEPAGLTAGFSIFDQQDQNRVVRGVLRRMDLGGAAIKPAQARARISKWKTAGDSPETALEEAAGFLERQVAEIYRAYERELAESNAVDFDDLLVRTLQMLRADEDVRGLLQRRFEFVMIDEYQDTSPVQFHLAAILAEPQRNVCATGDPDQSIYAFRNADVRNILEFERNYPGAIVVRLEENFRSVGNVLRAADGLIANNRDRHEKRLVATRDDGDLVRVLGADDEHAEGQLVADELLGSYSRGTPYQDMAVFYRVNAQSRALETALRARGIPYTIVKGVEFYQRAEVKDLVAYLRVLANPSDRESMTRVLTTPRRGVGAKTLERLFGAARERGWNARRALTAMADSGEVSKRATLALRDVEKLLSTLERSASGSVAELVRDAVLLLNYEEYLKRAYAEDAQDRIENVRELIGGAEEYDQRRGDEATLPDFLQEVGLVSDTDQYDPESPRVALMTLHSAKGLEFAEVTITGVEENLLPHARSAEDRKALEEERRLLFVGITRAKERLRLTYARDRRARITGGFGGGASQFLLEIPEEALDVDRQSLLGRQRSFGGGQSGGGQSGSGSLGGASFQGGAFDRGAPWARGGGRSAPIRASKPRWEPGVDPVVSYDGVDDDPSSQLRVGQRVSHGVFGEGTIRRLMGAGERARVVVFFRSAGEKTLALSHAKLTPLLD